MKLMKTTEAVGQVLCHDMTQIIPDVTKDAVFRKTLYLKNTDAQERELLLRGCLINYYAAKNEERHG